MKLPPWVSKIDAAISQEKDNSVYLFHKQFLWKLNLQTDGITDERDSQEISTVWKGVPDNIDAAYSGLGMTYFVKDDMVYMVNRK